MYNQNFKNQAVKECVNGQSTHGTAKKYGISTSALRSWVEEYKKTMAAMSGDIANNIEEETVQPDTPAKESFVQLRSINVNIDGHELTISKGDARKIMEIFHQFDE